MKWLFGISLLLVFCIAIILPPALPANFYGITDKAGWVTVKVDGVVVASTDTYTWHNQNVYQLQVLMDNIKPGTLGVFYLNGKEVRSAVLIPGGSTWLNLQSVRWIIEIGGV